MYEDLKSRIKKHEGFLAKVYLDSLGKATIGYGHLLTEEDVPSLEYVRHLNKRCDISLGITHHGALHEHIHTY